MKNKAYKGEFGYINYSKKRSMIFSIGALIITISIFLYGYITSGGNQNIYSIIAALGCLPTGWAIVNMVMFMRATPCSDKAHEDIEQVRGGLLMLYDLEMTSEKANYSIAACTQLERNIICYTEKLELDERDCEKHIAGQIAQSGYNNYTIKVFHDLSKFCDRVSHLEQLRQSHVIDPQAIEDAWVPGTTQTVPGILKSISL